MASNFSLPVRFIDELIERHWEKEPALFRRPFSRPLYSREETFHCLVAGRERILRETGGPPAFRFFVGNRLLQSDVAPFEPRADDGSLEAYAERLQRLVGDTHFGLTANEFHCGDPEIAQRMRGLLRPIYDRRGVGPHFAESFCFMGNYPVSPFGVHIDSASNLTYIVRGKKRYRLFKRPVLEQAKHVHSTSHYRPYLDQAVTFEAEEGDLVYWPSGTWHVAEHDGTDVAASVGLVVYMVRQPYELLAAAATRALRKRNASPTPLLFDAGVPTPGGEVPALPESIAALVGKGSDYVSDLEVEAQRLWLERLSCCSLDEALPPAPPPTLRPTDCIGIDREFPLLWARSGNRIVVAVRGSSLVLPFREATIRALQKLSEGEPCLVQSLGEPVTDPELTAALESLAAIHAFPIRS